MPKHTRLQEPKANRRR